jgi:hypothetical protein
MDKSKRILLPDIAQTPCQLFTLCGEIETDDPGLSAWLKKATEQVARYRGIIIHVVFGGGSTRHLHIDLATPDFFDATIGGKVTHRWREVQTGIRRLFGKKVDATAFGSFVLPVSLISDQSTIGRVSRPRNQTGERVGEVKAFDVRFDTGDLRRLAWIVTDDDDEEEQMMTVDVGLAYATTIQSDYIRSAFSRVENTIGAFVKDLSDEQTTNEVGSDEVRTAIEGTAAP